MPIKDGPLCPYCTDKDKRIAELKKLLPTPTQKMIGKYVVNELETAQIRIKQLNEKIEDLEHEKRNR